MFRRLLGSQSRLDYYYFHYYYYYYYYYYNHRQRHHSCYLIITELIMCNTVREYT
jgi:hypothetical protein